jgi:acetylornithine deacetylase/succinyl-diaminopimelate desuccinylase family protein
MDGAELRELAAELVRIPSVNPLDGPVEEGRREAEVAAYVAARLREAGIECELREASPGRPSVVARVAGESEEVVWFDSHIDTVSAAGMAFEPFEGRVEGDVLYGRGASDDKGSLAAMMGAMMAVAKGGSKPAATVVLTATADEEYRMTGLLGLLESGMTARAAIVGEPTALEVIVAHKGFSRFTIATTGKSVHSSRPEEGVNAIYRMGRVVGALEAYAKGGVGRDTHPMLGKATLSVGVIRGGLHVNVVPDRCEIDVDRRLLPGEEVRRALNDVRTYLDNALEEDVGIEMTGPHLVVPGMSVSSDHELVQAVSAAVREVTGRAPLGGMTGTTHAGPLAEAGIPGVVFGPGPMGQAHTATEELDLNQLEQAAAVYEALMRSGCR